MTSQFPTRQINRLTGHNGPVHAVTYSSGAGQYILTGSQDRSIRLFNASQSSSAPPIQVYSAHGYEVLDIAVNEDNSRFVSGGGDKTVFLWDVGRGETVRRWGGAGGHGGRINAVAWGGEGESVVVSGSFDATVRLWDTKSSVYKPLMVLSEARDSISTLAVVGHEIMSGSVDGRVRVYDIRMGMVFVDVIGQPVTSITPTMQNDSLLVSTLDSTLRLMDKTNGKLLQAYGAPNYKNTTYRLRSTLAFGDTTILSGSEDGSIYAWDLLQGTVLHVLQHNAPNDPSIPSTNLKTIPGAAQKESRKVVSAVAVRPGRGRKEWASAGGDGSVVVWGVDA